MSRSRVDSYIDKRLRETEKEEEDRNTKTEECVCKTRTMKCY